MFHLAVVRSLLTCITCATWVSLTPVTFLAPPLRGLGVGEGGSLSMSMTLTMIIRRTIRMTVFCAHLPLAAVGTKAPCPGWSSFFS